MSNSSSLTGKPGLALSGGGFRATLFHAGALMRLNELGLLKGMGEITSVSGGSIVSLYLGYKWGALQFDAQGVATNFRDIVVAPIRAFCKTTIDIKATLKGWITPGSHPSDQLSKIYAKALFQDATLQSLPRDTEGPRFTIYGTNLQTGVSIRLSKPYLADYLLGMLDNPDISLADAAAMSSAFPPLFVPMTIKTDPSRWTRTNGAQLFDEADLRATLRLGDGGIYDNMGLERMDGRDPILVSDAGSPFGIERGAFWLNWSHIARTMRTLDIVVEQTRRLRRRRLIDEFRRNVQRGTYWGIATRIADYQLPDALVADSVITASMRDVPTRLKGFGEAVEGRLINWGYALADAALRKHVIPPGAARGVLPLPQYPL